MDPFLAMVIADDSAISSGAITTQLCRKPASASFPRWHILWYLNGVHLRYIISVPLVLFHIGKLLSAAIRSWFLFYLNPSLQLLLGPLVFAEPFTNVDMVAFTLIRLALVLQFAPIRWLTSNRP